MKGIVDCGMMIVDEKLSCVTGFSQQSKITNQQLVLLSRPARVVLGRMHVFVVFQRFQMGSHFGGLT